MTERDTLQAAIQALAKARDLASVNHALRYQMDHVRHQLMVRLSDVVVGSVNSGGKR